MLIRSYSRNGYSVVKGGQKTGGKYNKKVYKPQKGLFDKLDARKALQREDDALDAAIEKKRRDYISDRRATELAKIITGQEYSPKDIGPNSTKDVPLLKSGHVSLKHKVLGVSYNTLKRSDVVLKKVEGFLKRKQLVKAIETCKVAQQKGAFGMDHVMEYVLRNRGFNPALQLFHNRIKWKIPHTQVTFTLFLNGVSKLKPPQGESFALSAAQGKSVEKIVDRLGDGDYEGIVPTVAHLNTSIGALLNSPSNAVAFDILMNTSAKFSGVKPDGTTLKIILNHIMHLKDNRELLDQLDIVLGFAKGSPKSYLDEVFYTKLIICYAHATDLKAVYFSTLLAQKCFSFDWERIELSQEEQNRLFLEKSPVNLKLPLGPGFRYKPTLKIFDTLMNCYNRLHRPDLTLKIYEELKKRQSMKIDLGIVHKLLTAKQLMDPHNAAQFSYDFYTNFEKNFPKLEPNDITRSLAFKGFKLQTGKESFPKDDIEECTKIFTLANDLFNFIKEENDGKVSSSNCSSFLLAINHLKLTSPQKIIMVRRSRMIKFFKRRSFKLYSEEAFEGTHLLL